jgi:hypothetical protein
MARPIKSIGYTGEPVAVTPFALGTAGFWVRLVDSHPMYTDRFGTDYDLLAF